MGFLDYFKARKPEKNSANIAKERLQIIVAHQRSELAGKDKRTEYIAQLQKEITEVLKKYIHVGQDDIKISLDNQGDCSVLELNVTIPDKTEFEAQQAKS
ncbi:cell division topological specificity factor MinE [Facilibium subflavum]|uniref:cell division topological specificity factor MinE n=1 Tax=Facilibium subflavum TaxID=2219058 RepID=UPI000E649568|nr:cell division topological specificity factor MinE [Facilibium subflavum]